MIAVYAKCVVSGLNVDKFIALAKELVEETRKEPENISYELIRGREGKNVFAFLERWPSQAVLDAHMRTEHFKRLIPQIQKLSIGGVDIVTHEVIL
ncbi:MAG: antibiotic biosynthesis monooxygenase [Lachnospiraceae bacterium]|nr:antibiotic biosynthesis monooxygenase [Lachnospiraceae bacterium]